MDGLSKAVRGEPLISDLELLLEADRAADAAPADLQQDLAGDLIVRGAQQLDKNFGERARLLQNVDRRQSLG